MKVDLGIWSVFMQLAAALLAVAVLALIGTTYLPLIHQNEQMRKRIDYLDGELEKQRQISRDLQTEFDALRSDPKTVERLAREKLGYAKADETVVHFDPPVTNTAGR